MTRWIVFAFTIIPVASLAADGPDAAALLRSQIAVTKEAAEVLKTVTDRASAERVKSKLAELDARYEELQKRFQSRPEGEQVRAFIDSRADRDKADDGLGTAHDQVFAKHKDAYMELATTGTFKRVESRLINAAKLRMQMIEQACKAYYAAHGKWPPALKVLVEKGGELPPRLEGGPKGVLDPWGAPYDYQIVVDDRGSERVFLSTPNPYGNGKQVIRWPNR